MFRLIPEPIQGAVSMTTVRGLADALGISPATVSRSLNNSPEVSEAVRDRVIAEAERRGYALPKRRVRSQMIGLIFFNETSGPKFSGYDGVVWGGVTRAAMSMKYDVRLIDPLDRGPSESFTTFTARKGVEGLVLRVDEGTRHVCSLIAQEGIPHIVIADRFDDDEAVNYLCCNSKAATRSAVEHLLHLGHTRIAVCHNYVLDTDHCDRIAGYKSALSDAGVEHDSELIVTTNADIGGGMAALNRLMSLPRPPTAIVFTDPALTVGAMRRALEVGISVPSELSIVGMDDERLRKMTHPVYTAVCQNAAELGQQAARWLCRRLAHADSDGAGPPVMRQSIEAFLEINQTTAAPPEKPVRVTPTGQRLDT
jgi:LacI family transcriptional regulator